MLMQALLIYRILTKVFRELLERQYPISEAGL